VKIQEVGMPLKIWGAFWSFGYAPETVLPAYSAEKGPNGAIWTYHRYSMALI